MSDHEVHAPHGSVPPSPNGPLRLAEFTLVESGAMVLIDPSTVRQIYELLEPARTCIVQLLPGAPGAGVSIISHVREDIFVCRLRLARIVRDQAIEDLIDGFRARVRRACLN